jgi:hypothetical protein
MKILQVIDWFADPNRFAPQLPFITWQQWRR